MTQDTQSASNAPEWAMPPDPITAQAALDYICGGHEGYGIDDDVDNAKAEVERFIDYANGLEEKSERQAAELVALRDREKRMREWQERAREVLDNVWFIGFKDDECRFCHRIAPGIHEAECPAGLARALLDGV